MLRPRRLATEAEVDMTLVAGVTGMHPSVMDGYIVLAMLKDGSCAMATNACCVHHAAHEMAGLAVGRLKTCPPCSPDCE